jgi:hypothetical protein
MTDPTPMKSIRIIGPISSGKTTYLTALCVFNKKGEFSGLEIVPLSEDAKRLKAMAEDIVERSDKIRKTKILDNPEKLPNYEFMINVSQPKQEMNLQVRDYPGDIYEDIANYQQSKVTKNPSPDEKLRKYIDHLFENTQGWMVMLTDWSPQQGDRTNKSALEYLCEEIATKEVDKQSVPQRIAVVMAKCERGEIWTGRIDPGEDLFKIRLPETYNFLTQTAVKTNKISSQRFKFFACSSFGVLNYRKDPRPNRKIDPNDDSGGSHFYSVLADPDKWQPYGLISPIYWLITGGTLPNERI